MTFEQLQAIRRRGEKPEVLVLSLVGRIKGLMFPVLVLVGEFDPRWFAGMTIYLAHAGEGVERIVGLCEQLDLAGVENLETWNVLTNDWLIIVAQKRREITRGVPECVS